MRNRAARRRVRTLVPGGGGPTCGDSRCRARRVRRRIAPASAGAVHGRGVVGGLGAQARARVLAVHGGLAVGPMGGVGARPRSAGHRRRVRERAAVLLGRRGGPGRGHGHGRRGEGRGTAVARVARGRARTGPTGAHAGRARIHLAPSRRRGVRPDANRLHGGKGLGQVWQGGRERIRIARARPSRSREGMVGVLPEVALVGAETATRRRRGRRVGDSCAGTPLSEPNWTLRARAHAVWLRPGLGHRCVRCVVGPVGRARGRLPLPRPVWNRRAGVLGLGVRGRGSVVPILVVPGGRGAKRVHEGPSRNAAVRHIS
mmetsp:Transcript_27707/g.81436  ORF Transcript_27707/g.81436 Transcript_27707/m.81436 type:complete len:316 (+) Transcript_27707:254-1201(+)